MKTIKKDITTIEKGVIISQVNCQNTMGSGLARAIYEKWPAVKEKYHEFCSLNLTITPGLGDLNLLGEIQDVYVQFDPQITVINVFGQLNYGNGARNGQRYTDYGALKSAFSQIRSKIIYGNYNDNESGEVLPFYIPKFLGAGLGAGDYKIIHRLIEYYLPNAVLVDY